MPHQCSELAATSNHSRKIFKIHRVPPQARASLILSEAWGVRCHRPPCAERAAEAQQHFRNDTWREMTLGPFTAPGGEPCLRLRRHRLPLPSPQTAPVSAEGQPVAASHVGCVGPPGPGTLSAQVSGPCPAQCAVIGVHRSAW